VLERVRRIEAICARHKVSLPAAALQFPLGHPLVSSVIPGARSADELEQNLAYLREDIPSSMWTDLRDSGLIAQGAPFPMTDEG
ncbi:aldo/keto reductase, partial [Mesorhizobium sp. M2A.F.Ca.ET.037.01.1.1]